jgi:hypothetical protein
MMSVALRSSILHHRCSSDTLLPNADTLERPDSSLEPAEQDAEPGLSLLDSEDKGHRSMPTL